MTALPLSWTNAREETFLPSFLPSQALQVSFMKESCSGRQNRQTPSTVVDDGKTATGQQPHRGIMEDQCPALAGRARELWSKGPLELGVVNGIGICQTEKLEEAEEIACIKAQGDIIRFRFEELLGPGEQIPRELKLQMWAGATVRWKARLPSSRSSWALAQAQPPELLALGLPDLSLQWIR